MHYHSNLAPECEQPLETGLCRAYFVRYGFSTQLGKCTTFVYGGCPVNDNNFETRAACEERCEDQ